VAASVFNIAKGRVTELYNRVDLGDPSGSRLVIAALATSGLQSDATLLDLDTFAAVIAGATNEVTNSGYARKVLAAADLAAITPDDANDRFDLDIPDQTWTGIGTGDGWSKLVICYDPSSAGVTDALMVPLTLHDFAVTPDGADILARIASAGFYRAA
jgi:hypothetical protein